MEKLYQIALGLVPGIGDVTAKNLIAYCGSAEAVFKDKKGHLQKVPGVGPKMIVAIQKADVLPQAEAVWHNCEKQQIDVLHYTDKTYPKRLKLVADCPNLLYVKGELVEWPRTLAVVGTRQATHYGREVTERIVQESSTLQLCIVSGLAYGIDITAHRAALKHQTPTVGVLAGGLDRIYPSAHRKTAEDMQTQGCLISENPPGVEPEPHFFPARNRIIAGLSDAVVVVEAASKGGALITAHIADSYNRVVFAVPGNLNNSHSEGCNLLIRNQKALIYTGIQDLIYHLNWDMEAAQTPTPRYDLSALTEPERQLVCILQNHLDGIAIDELAWKSQISINQVASHLLSLEFQGLVKSLPGKKFKLA